MLTFDHEAFKEKEKEKKEREKEMKDKSKTDPETLLAQLEASLQVNTVSNMDFKTNYSDFKSGMYTKTLTNYNKIKIYLSNLSIV